MVFLLNTIKARSFKLWTIVTLFGVYIVILELMTLTLFKRHRCVRNINCMFWILVHVLKFLSTVCISICLLFLLLETLQWLPCIEVFVYCLHKHIFTIFSAWNAAVFTVYWSFCLLFVFTVYWSFSPLFAQLHFKWRRCSGSQTEGLCCCSVGIRCASASSLPPLTPTTVPPKPPPPSTTTLPTACLLLLPPEPVPPSATTTSPTLLQQYH